MVNVPPGSEFAAMRIPLVVVATGENIVHPARTDQTPVCPGTDGP
jgi:hypothetical protein